LYFALHWGIDALILKDSNRVRVVQLHVAGVYTQVPSEEVLHVVVAPAARSAASQLLSHAVQLSCRVAPLANGQASPPADAGVEMEYVLLRTPSPQLALQAVQSLQEPTQSTGHGAVEQVSVRVALEYPFSHWHVPPLAAGMVMVNW
jgi:hypothetical protein